FGRDMMVTSLLMEPVWDPAMLEHVIASVLRKLSPDGRVSHEEALGGQAIREGAAEYNALVRRALGPGGGARADTLLARARAVLADLQRVRENYRMVDDDFQLPVVAARYLANPRVPADRKRAFLGDTTLARLLRNLAYVAEAAGPYADRPEALNLVGFPPADGERWYSGSWRDSGPGYANGRFAMDVNAIWVPEALAGIARIFAALEALGYEPARLERAAPWLRGGRLGAWVRDSAALARAIATWRGAVRHFLVRLAPAEVTARVQAKLASLPEPERAYWLEVWRRHETPGDTLEFLGLSLDRRGQPIPVMNSDPAMRLLLQDVDEVEARRALRPFLLRYPVGLLVDGLGPLVANDAYAPPAVWEPWRTDLYHSPRVVWGREVNILSMALARAPDRPGFREALAATRRAVEVSGLGHAELWTYGVEGGRLVPRRYGASSDVQLWNLTDLAVEFALARLGAP
ncbi:MAG TPA: hypothetical protein VNI61_02945, partial [Gemmatimonadales bacterium]|nr:hypothetical protein [Gemmatimonadales bacterium]